MGYKRVTVGTGTSVQIVSDNVQRLSLVITNSGGEAAFLAQDSSVTTANGILIVSTGTLCEDSGGTKMYCGPFYAIASDSTTTLAYWERTRGSE